LCHTGATANLNLGAFKVNAALFNDVSISTNVDVNPSNNATSIFIGKLTNRISFLSVAIGYGSGRLSVGDRNVHIGNQSGELSNGSNNFYMGSSGLSSTGGNNIAIGQALNGGNASYSVALGFSTMGNLVGNNSQHVVLGFQAGNGLVNCNGIIAMGINSAREMVNGNSVVAIGSDSGYGATNISNSFLFGVSSGRESVGFSNSTAIGTIAGYLTKGNDNVLIGYASGSQSILSYCTAMGSQSGSSVEATDSVYVGRNSGQVASFSSQCLMFGNDSGSGAFNSHNAILFGTATGFTADNIPHLIAVGNYAGYQAINSGHSIFVGDYSGYQDTVSNIETGAISTISKTPVDGGTGFNVNDICTITSGSGDATVRVTAIDFGQINTFTIINSGASYLVGDLVYAQAGDYAAEFEVATTDGNNAPITAVSIGSNAGINYIVGDIVFVQGGQIQIDTVDGLGAVTSISIFDSGLNNYVNPDEVALGGSGTDLLINVDAVGSSIGAVLTLTKNTNGELYSIANVPFSGGSGFGLEISVDTITNGAATLIQYQTSGTSGYEFGGTGYENPAVNGVNTLYVYITGLQNIVVTNTSIAVGRYSGTGGFSNSIAIGRGVINSAQFQANIGNVLFLDGIYSNDTQSSTPMASSSMTVAGLIKCPNMPTADPIDGSATLWYDAVTNQVYRGT